MIKVIAGPKGFGKTKAFIEDINQAVAQAKGNVVCIEKSNRLMYDLDKSIRLIDTQEFELSKADVFAGFLYGIISQDFDITNIFIESLNKIIPDKNEYEAVVEAAEKIGEKFNIDFTITVSAVLDDIPAGVKKYID
ncbi:MAG: hypothetical protein PHE51_03800 [Eubacteriales bacterium]|nr:hypothetical protein [Eubacteriales bacterium]